MHLGIFSVMSHPSALMIVMMFGHLSDGGVKI